MTGHVRRARPMARIVLDLDGTLIDFNPTLWAPPAARFSPNPPPAGLRRNLRPAFVGKGRPGPGRRPPQSHRRHPRRPTPTPTSRASARSTPPTRSPALPSTPGVAAALAAPAAAGHGLARLHPEAEPAGAGAARATLGLMPPITGFTGGDSLPVLKPDPRMLRHAADQLPPGPVILVGDSEIDAATAAAAGVPFLLHSEGYRLAPR